MVPVTVMLLVLPLLVHSYALAIPDSQEMDLIIV